jgi:hypothetical protein
VLDEFAVLSHGSGQSSRSHPHVETVGQFRPDRRSGRAVDCGEISGNEVGSGPRSVCAGTDEGRLSCHQSRGWFTKPLGIIRRTLDNTSRS